MQHALFNQSRVENQVAALALPAHGLVIGNIITSWVCNCREMTCSVTNCSCCHWDLNSFTIPARAAHSLTFWWPWSYHTSHHHHLLSFHSFMCSLNQLGYCSAFSHESHLCRAWNQKEEQGNNEVPVSVATNTILRAAHFLSLRIELRVRTN